MAVSKRTRFEVLKRDNYTCRYCRSDEGALTIDHVTPVALGGTDDPANLVACCKDCNAGKSSTSPDEATVADVTEDAVRWARARRRAAADLADQQQARRDRIAPFLEVWGWWDKTLMFLPADYEESVNRWLDSGLSIEQIVDAHDIAIGKPQVNSRGVFRYMCGVIRNWLADLDERTAQILASEESS